MEFALKVGRQLRNMMGKDCTISISISREQFGIASGDEGTQLVRVHPLDPTTEFSHGVPRISGPLYFAITFLRLHPPITSIRSSTLLEPFINAIILLWSLKHPLYSHKLEYRPS